MRNKHEPKSELPQARERNRQRARSTSGNVEETESLTITYDYETSWLIAIPGANTEPEEVKALTSLWLYELHASLGSRPQREIIGSELLDPYSVLKAKADKVFPETLVSYETVGKRTQQAAGLLGLGPWYQTVKDQIQAQMQGQGPSISLDSQIVQKGQHPVEHPFQTKDQDTYLSLKDSTSHSVGKKRKGLIDSKTFGLIRELRSEHGLSVQQLTRRFPLTPFKLNQIIRAKDYGEWFSQFQDKTSKLVIKPAMSRYIDEMLSSAQSPLRVNKICSNLEESFKVKISKSTVTRHLKASLHYSFTRVYHLNFRANILKSKLLRQQAASTFIKELSEGQEIVNIDESSLQFTDNSTKCWQAKGQQKYFLQSKRLSSISIIAAVTSSGKLFISVNKGRNNSLSVYFFVLRLVQRLSIEGDDWRTKFTFLIDNASYHKSGYLRTKFRDIGIRLGYLGPYQFNMAPVEKVFSHIKKHQLLMQDFPLPKRGQSKVIIRELANRISQLEFPWIKAAFEDSVKHALSALALQSL